MRMPSLARVSFACAGALCAGCSSAGPAGGELATPGSFDGFPADASVDIVQAEARFYVNHDELLAGCDLIEEQGVIPIALRVGLRGAGMNETQARLLTDGGGMRLYLPDGTALSPRDYSKIEIDDDEQRDALYGVAHKGGALTSFDHAAHGLLFFALPAGDEYDADSRSIVRRSGGVRRVLDLTKCVCSFEVSIGDETRTLYIGLKADRSLVRR